MRWYEGNIAEAVARSKSKNAYFVVYIEGDDQNSATFTQTIDRPEILALLENDSNFVAIKIKVGTEAYKHFEQIYLIVGAPSLYFINTQTGTPDGLIYGAQNDLDKKLTDKIKELLAKKAFLGAANVSVSTSLPNPAANSASGSSRDSTSAFISAEKQDTTAKASKSNDGEEKSEEEGYKVVCEGGVCRKVKIEATPSDDGASSSSNLSVDDKVQRAKELLEKKRIEKMEEEKRLEKQRELDRRSQGHGLAELKKWQQEQELKTLKEERQKEKREAKEAKERILAQIAQDRAERQKMFSSSPGETSAPETPQPTTPPPPTESKSTVTKIQFRMADGSTHTMQAEPDSTLAELRQYVRENIQTSGAFTLSTMYPRQCLTEDQNSETLRSLGLHPSSVLLLLRGGASSSSNVSGSSAPVANTGGFFGMISQLLWSVLFQPAYGLWNWLSSLVGGNQTRASDPPPSSAPSTSTAARPNPGQGARKFPSESENSEVKRRRGNTSGTTSIRREGNTYRLKDNDSDDENNTWNGNSTQQM